MYQSRLIIDKNENIHYTLRTKYYLIRCQKRSMNEKSACKENKK
jgi:hypothetical protein